jgi:predicted metal-binding membrane protein
MNPAERRLVFVQVGANSLALVAWIVLIARSLLQSGACCSDSLSGVGNLNEAYFAQLSPTLMDWALMLVAMMAPMLSSSIFHVAQRSLARRRVRSGTLFAFGYFFTWMIAGIVLSYFAYAVKTISGQTWFSSTLICLLTLVWQCTPAKRMCLNRCHAHGEIAAFGLRADLDSMRFGFNHATWCIGTCWAIMILPEFFGPSHLLVMAVMTVFLAAERLEHAEAPRWGLILPKRTLRYFAEHCRKVLKHTSRQQLLD